MRHSFGWLTVLTAPALVVAVLLVGPAVGDDDDPAPSYKASFDACEDVPRSGFSDVSRSHSNARDIDCVAYYGIAMGTSTTAFSPLAPVPRKEMALFLIRLAKMVGIEVVPDPDDSGFLDTGDLSEGSRTAVAQLVELGIFAQQATFHPAKLVSRAETAFLLAQLMDQMTPMTDASRGIPYGYTPSDVGQDREFTADVDESRQVALPFNDLGPALKVHYDAIVQLYELGVAVGTSEREFEPSLPVTRASLAGFMAAVLDHSNVRPAGLSFQAFPSSGWGDTNITLVVSMRDDDFAPVGDQTVDVFGVTDHAALAVDGQCGDGLIHFGDCVWGEQDEMTDAAGNLFVPELVSGGDTTVYYAWIGEKARQRFDADEVSYESLSVATRRGHASLHIGGINERAATLDSEADADSDDDESQVDLGATSRVALKIQLLDNAGERVPRSGIEITGSVRRVAATYADGAEKSYVPVSPQRDDVTLTTGGNGSTTFTLESPEDDDDDDRQEFLDVITFTSGALEETRKIRWIEEDRVTFSADGVAPNYVLLDRDDEVRVSGTVTLYDQYGRRLRQGSGQRVTIDFEGAGDSDNGTVAVRTSGVATRRVTLEDQSAGTDITVSYDPVDVATDSVELDQVVTAPPDDTVSVVIAAKRGDTGPKDVHTLHASRNLFTTEVGSPDGVADAADRLYRYDPGDFFVGHSHIFDINEFEELLANPTDSQGNPADNQAVVDIVLYNPGGLSVFVVTTDSAGN